MAGFATRAPGETAAAASASLLLVAALAIALILGLRGRAGEAGRPLSPAILLSPEPRPSPSPPPAPRVRPHGEARPAAVRPEAPAAAPPAPPLPMIVLVPPAPVAAVVAPATGVLAGTAGDGAGAAGDGRGGGGGADVGRAGARAAIQIAGRLSAHDLPHDALPPGGSLSVGVAYTVGADGRVRDCTVPASSGLPEVDALVCRLLERRFRYRPARDAAGDPVASAVRETHSWARRPDRASPAGKARTAACADPVLC